MNLMARAKKAVKKVTKKVAKPEKGSKEWLAMKAEARRRLDNR